jgi:hypothetical protein
MQQEEAKRRCACGHGWPAHNGQQSTVCTVTDCRCVEFTEVKPNPVIDQVIARRKGTL